MWLSTMVVPLLSDRFSCSILIIFSALIIKK
jgi:hypothetical protein